MPTPRGKLVAKDYVRFFKENTERTKTLLSNDSNSVGLWAVIFELRFKDLPQPGQGESFRIKRGSTDPRWEILLHQEKALRIVMNLREHWQKTSGPWSLVLLQYLFKILTGVWFTIVRNLLRCSFSYNLAASRSPFGTNINHVVSALH